MPVSGFQSRASPTLEKERRCPSIWGSLEEPSLLPFSLFSSLNPISIYLSLGSPSSPFCKSLAVGRTSKLRSLSVCALLRILPINGQESAAEGAGAQGRALSIDSCPSGQKVVLPGCGSLPVPGLWPEGCRSMWEPPSSSLQVWIFAGTSMCAFVTGHGPASQTEYAPGPWCWLSLARLCSPGRPRPTLAATVPLGVLSWGPEPGAGGGDGETGLSLCPLQGTQASKGLYAVSLGTYSQGEELQE